MTTSIELSTEFLHALDLMEPEGEFFCGEVTQKPMGTRTHGTIQWWLMQALTPFVEERALGALVLEWRCVFGPPDDIQTFVPDLTFVASNRLTDEEYVRFAPDLAIEVLSPGQPNRRFNQKIQFYLDHGVRLVWIIDPVARAIQVLAPGAEPVTLRSGDTLGGGAVLPGFQLGVDEVFARL